MANKKFLDRHDLARLLEVSVDVVARNEKRLGLVPIRLNRKSIRYATKATLEALRKRNILPED